MKVYVNAFVTDFPFHCTTDDMKLHQLQITSQNLLYITDTAFVSIGKHIIPKSKGFGEERVKLDLNSSYLAVFSLYK